MSSARIERLPTLQPDSGVRISTSVIHGATARSGARLITMDYRNGKAVGIARTSSSSLQYGQKLMTLTSGQSGFMRGLNQSLKGGSSYPVLTFALGTAVGFISGGAGLVFAVATTGLDLSRRDSDVLARNGDEIWAFEALGKIYERNWISEDGWVAKHVTSYFLCDPYRSNRNAEKGWLIHESRTDVIFE